MNANQLEREIKRFLNKKRVGAAVIGVSQPGAALPAGIVTDAVIVTSYTIVYTNVAIGAAVAAGGGVTVFNNGLVIGGLNSGGFYAVSLAGVVTTPTAHSGGNLPNSSGFESAGGTYYLVISNTVAGFEVFKNGAFFGEFTSSLANAPTHFGMSPNGKYFAMVNATANTIELWVGA